ncbi:hypothetical protein Cme02nite_44110 [Catellatospora methionotrophica]|uniref:Uncharacterized protein n=1 Tax=Catellatospora methionotrophica TaxID=121620 RepID=A0A8J3LCQ8_9ACTN|nr:hypothetical protein Cme02nite_44110 [Catellatospora methionotrophica]
MRASVARAVAVVSYRYLIIFKHKATGFNVGGWVVGLPSGTREIPEIAVAGLAVALVMRGR